MTITRRISKIQEELVVNQIDVALILKPHNVFYFAGYAPVCAGILIFPDAEPIFCTLWLDAPEVKTFCALSNVTGYVFPAESLMGKLVDLIKKRKPHLRKIGVEKDFMLVRDYEILSGQFREAEFVHIGPAIDRLRAIKSEEEIEKMRKSAAISDRAMEAALHTVEPGVTELDVAAEAEYVMRKSGSEKPAFGPFIASGERTLLAHPYATRREIREGDPVVIDLGATWQGYASDICRTTFAGEPAPEQIKYLRLVVQAQEVAASMLEDGVRCSEIYEAVYRVFQEENLGKFLPNDIGYGVGLRQSEFYPIIEKGSKTILRENMVVALLQTTAFSKKIGGLRVEDVFRVTRNAAQRLTSHIQTLYD